MPRDNICMNMEHVCFYVCCSDCVSLIFCMSGVNRVQVVLSGFSVRLFCFFHVKTVCMVVCISWLHSCLCVEM